MKKITPFLQLQILFFALLISSISYAQIGVGTTTPAGGSILDITSADKGILVPRVNIANLGTIAPVTGGATVGLLVWNTNGGTGVGYHYWDGNDWVPIGGSSGPSVDWALAGNAAAATDVLGTTNAQPLVVVTNGTEQFRVLPNALGQIIAGSATPSDPPGTGSGDDDKFTSIATLGDDAITGATEGGFGVQGQATGAVAGGILFGDAVVGTGAAAGVVGTGYFTLTEGVIGIGEDTGGLGVNGVWGIQNDPNGTAILGGVNNLYVYPNTGTGVAGSGARGGIYGYAGNGAVGAANEGNSAGVFILDTDANPGTTGNNGTRAYAQLAGFDNVAPAGAPAGSRNSYFGGYFTGGSSTGTYAYVGMRYRTTNTGGSNGNTVDYKIIGTGSVSTLVNDENNTPRIMFAPEAPEILFEDYGVGTLTNGEAKITLDPILVRNIHVDENNPLKVFIQLEGDCNGVFVTNKSANGFTVKELQNGQSSVPFSWHIVASRADSKDDLGNITSNHVGTRFPIGPGPLDEVSSQKKEKNRKISKSDLVKRKKSDFHKDLILTDKVGKKEKE